MSSPPPLPPPPPFPPPPPTTYGYAPPPTDGMAIASLVLGILAAVGVFCYGVPAVILGPIAIFLGLKARGRIKAAAGTVGGGGLAMAGWITGIAATSLGALILIFFIGVFALVAFTGHSFVSPTPTR